MINFHTTTWLYSKFLFLLYASCNSPEKPFSLEMSNVSITRLFQARNETSIADFEYTRALDFFALIADLTLEKW